jgi:DNA processing protein
MSDHKYLHAFAQIPGLGPKRFTLLSNYANGDIQSLWENSHALPDSLLPPKLKHAILEYKSAVNIEKDFKKLEVKEICILGKEDQKYPFWLKQSPDAPFILYTRGNLPENNHPLITVVGTRTMSDYGESVVKQIIGEITKHGIGIISGLAYGIDAAAHRSAIIQKTYTAAVLGSGVDIITPKGNTRLAKQILASGGGILSEFPPGTESQSGHFPRRNRILAALSPVTLVIEAAQKSGALITAHFALDYNRDVYAIPGSIFSKTSKGTNSLIQQGAKLIQSAKEILEVYNIEDTPPRQIEIDKAQQVAYELLTLEPQHLDVLASKFHGPSSELLALLSELEMKGAVTRVIGKGYKRLF